jgi:hypothetical protein
MKQLATTTVILLVTVVITGSLSAAVQATDALAPEIDVSCRVVQVLQLDPGEPRQVIVEFSWQSRHATEVHIQSMYSATWSPEIHPPKGSFRIEKGGNFSFVAVGEGGAATKLINCYFPTGQRGGEHVDLAYEISRTQSLYQLFASSHRSSPVAVPLDRMSSAIVQALQRLGYVTNLDQTPPPNSVLVHTDAHRPNELLCEGDECQIPLAGRNIERMVAFSILYGPDRFLDSDSGKTAEKYLRISTSVIKRARRGGGQFERETGAPVSRLTQQLSMDILKAVTAKP